jgi:hypothetical protein
MSNVTVTVAPAHVGLGDPFTVTVDAEGAGTLSAPDGPFAEVRAPTVSRSGDHTRIVKTLVCVDRGCAPGKTARTVVLPTARLTSGTATIRSARAQVVVAPRVSASAVSASHAAYQAPTAIPGTTTPLGLVAVLALVLAAACVAAALFALRRRPADAEPLRWDLPLALRLLRESAARPARDRRRAADLVAAMTADTEATRLAWAPREPEPSDVEQLADRVAGGAG